jgi:photosystem II stability/assembly factor-like uncharacterized protein
VGRALALFVLALVVAGPARANGPWLSFLDRQHGWAAGAGGLLATADGGRTWTAVYRGPLQIWGIQFLDGRWGAGLSGAGLVRTQNGGRTWRTLATGVDAATFASRREGWALTRFQRLRRTDDGGRTWRAVRTPARPSSLCAEPGGVLWLSSSGMLFVTRNAGRTWTRAFVERADPGGSGWVGRVGCRGKQVWALFTGGAATSHQAYVVAHSSDGGRSWTQPLAQTWFHVGQRTLIDAYAGPFVLAARGAFFLGSCGPCGRGRVSLTSTRNEGRTFRRTAIGPLAGREATAVAFPDLRHGFVATTVGTGTGAVWVTSDGGRTWRRSVLSTVLRPLYT